MGNSLSGTVNDKLSICGCPIPGGIQGLGPGQPYLVGGNTIHGRGLELNDL